MKRRFKVRAQELPVGELRLNAQTNRQVQPGRVRRLVRDMDPDALGRFAVWRDGRDLYVIDGQHRKLALEELGLPDWPVLCDVYEGMSFQDACEQFLKLNDGLVVRPFDKFDKGRKAGHEECVETARIVEAAGFRITDQARDGDLKAVQAAREVWRQDRGETLAATLEVVVAAWGHEANAVEGVLLRGLGKFVGSYNGQVDRAVLVGKLRKVKPANLIGSARAIRDIEGGSTAHCVALVVRGIYNKGRRSGQLPPL